MHAAITDHEKEIIELSRRYGVTKLEAFGSAARWTDFDLANSDADFLVVLDRSTDLDGLRQYFGFANALACCWGGRWIYWKVGPSKIPIFAPASISTARSFIRRDPRVYSFDMQGAAEAILSFVEGSDFKISEATT